jgi:hypothetical protein
MSEERSMNRMCVLPALLTAIFAFAEDFSQDPADTVLVGEGGVCGLSALGVLSHLVVCSPDDCPTCYEFLIAEIGRLAREPAWKGRWAVIAAAGESHDATFARWIRDRYDPPVPLFAATRRTIARLIPAGIPATPCIVWRKENGAFADPWTISPRTQAAATILFDSLFAAGPGRSGP